MGTEVFFSYTVSADSAIGTQLIIRTFAAFFVAFGANTFDTLRAPATADTDKFRAHLTCLAVIAEATVSACTVLADIAASADLFIRTVGTFFVAVRADCCTV